MKERPILFSSPMVRAILEGRKTQTRRVVKPQPDSAKGWLYPQKMHGFTPEGRPFGNWLEWRMVGEDYPDTPNDSFFCPYGQPGDQLWVKETWRPVSAWQGSISGCEIEYRADGAKKAFAKVWSVPKYKQPWKPSIHMFKDVSRITLEITGIRVERLQDISKEDSVFEGIEVYELEEANTTTARFGDAHRYTAKEAYRDLWESINGPGSWDANPYVWVVEFKRINQ